MKYTPSSAPGIELAYSIITQCICRKVRFRKDGAGYFNTSKAPQSTAGGIGGYALMIAGYYSQASYAYCYHRVFEVNIDLVERILETF